MRGIRWSSIRGSWYVAIVALLLMAVGSIVTAQSQGDQPWQTRDQNQQQAQGTEYERIGDLMGADVFGRDGEKIGSFHDIVFDQNQERVLYAVISESGWMGTEGDLHAIPWSMVQSQPRDNRVVLPVGKSSFENRQPISDNYLNQQLDQMAQQWTSVQKWEQSPAAKDGSSKDKSDRDGNIFERSQRDRQSRSQGQRPGDAAQMRRVNDLLGMNVQFSGSGTGGDFGYNQGDGAQTNGRSGSQQQMSGGANGNLEDLLIHRDGRVEFALVQPNTDFVQIGEDEYVAVPWDRINVQSDRDMVMANLSSSEAHALVIDDAEISRLNDPSFRNRFYSEAGLDDSCARRDNGNRSRTGSTGQPSAMGQQQAMEQWSDFASQCLGSGLNKQNQVVEGRVLTVGKLRTNPDSDAPHGRMITVETANNRDMRVYLGPQELVPENFNIREGAQVTVRGTECQIDNRDIMVASSVEFDGQTFTLT